MKGDRRRDRTHGLGSDLSRPATKSSACDALSRSRRDFLKSAAGLGAAGTVLALGVAPRRAASAEPLKIGCMGPFSGPARRTGDGFKKGVIMALENAREEGELPLTLDGQRRDIEVVWVDSQSDPETAVRAVLDAITNQGVQFLINGWHSSVALAVMEAEAPLKIVHLGHMGETQFIADKINKDPEKYKGWFKGWPSPPKFAARYGQPLLDFIKVGLWDPANRKVAIITEDTDYGHGWGQALVENLRHTGFDPMPYDIVGLEETDFASSLAKYKSENVSLVAMSTGGNVSAANFVKQFRDARMKALLVAHGLTWFSEWHEMTGDASDYIVTMDSAAPIAPWQLRWLTLFNVRYNEAPSISASGLPYDYTRMAIKVLNEAGTLDFETLTRTIYDTAYDGVWNRYQFSREPGANALSANEVMTGDSYREGFFHPMVQLFGGKRKIIWPFAYAEARFAAPPWL